MKISIYRFNPDTDKKPYNKVYDVKRTESDTMLLDLLIKIKATDDSLSMRMSCREGVCGSDAMNINGKNGLACVTKIDELKKPIVIRP
ncbi:MAG: succinate dehydrogenase iron-sulfur subunit, partial [Nitrosomonadales bacterium]|nr:succinate dehydrogenase iron-sulfur subunit [Nitrosomonadales bacterium]